MFSKIAQLDSSKPNINSVEVHPQQLGYNGHPMDGALVGAGSLWPGEGNRYLGGYSTSAQSKCVCVDYQMK